MSLMGANALTFEPNGKQPIKLYTAHEHWLICPTHVLWKFNSRPCEKPQCLPCILLAKRPPQLWRYTRLLENVSTHVDQFLAPSRFTANMHAERKFPQRLIHLPYFIERADDNWKTAGPRPQERPYFLFVGRLEIIKGLQTLIGLWSRVQGADLLVAGIGNYEKELRRMACGNSNIRFLGALSQQQLGNLYYHAIACIVPSITYETFGMIIIEAFARKTPVIVRDLGAFPEVIDDSGGGFIYRTEEELLDAIERIAHSPTLRAELGEKGYRAFVENWSKEAHLELYFGVLRTIALRRFGYVPWEDEGQQHLSERCLTVGSSREEMA